MDAERFDTLAQMLAISADRRKILQALAASATGTFLFRVQGTSTAAQIGAACTVTSDCVTDNPCVSFFCLDGMCGYGIAECGMFNPAITCCLDVEAGKVTCCGEDQSCVDGTCQGPSGEGGAEGEVCIDGLCAQACADDSDCPGQECQFEGHCQPDGTCISVEMDPCIGTEDDSAADEESDAGDGVVTTLPDTGGGGRRAENEGRWLWPFALVGAGAAVVASRLQERKRSRGNSG